MRFRNRRIPHDCITSDALALFGRSELLGADLSGVATVDVYQLIEPLAMQTYTADGIGTSGVLEELRRHAAMGEWEAVGAWKFVRDFFQDPESAALDLIDAGLLALERMAITNLGFHLPAVDRPRYEALSGGPVPNDGFWGPPVFDSRFGPNRQFYFDDAVSFARSRHVQRVLQNPGVDPIRAQGAVTTMWDFGLLVFRGPLRVNSDIRFEPSVVRRAVEAANGVDHQLFVDRLCDELFEGEKAEIALPWSMMGAGRFVEDYLDVGLIGSRGHERLVDSGLQSLVDSAAIGLTMTPDVLSSFELGRLRLIQSCP